MHFQPYKKANRGRFRLSEVQVMQSTELDALGPQTPQSQLFLATFDLVSSALVLLDEQGRMLKVNGAFAQLLGYALPELLGKPFLDLLQCPDRENLQALQGTGTPADLTDLSLELRYRCKDGSVLHGRSKLVAVGTLLLGAIVPLQAPRTWMSAWNRPC
ncbi:PAS domain S-box protein [Pseudomonas batumici]|uniref:PAS domain S-box protein n=1 Tax=Pseudomonas batumici TaxID=226910 RepID=UPI0030CBD568